MNFFNLEFGTEDFFKNHGYFFLIFIALFPRLTLLFSSVVSGGFLWWLSFIFYPRILVASLATIAYFKTNPELVVISWLIAIPAEAAEKWAIGQPRFHIKTFYGGKTKGQASHTPQFSNTVEAEYKVIDREDS